MNATRIRGRRVRFFSSIIAQISAAALLVLAGGCMDDSGKNPVPEGPNSADPDPSLETFTVDPSGGAVQYKSAEHDVSLTLTFPPGALTESTEITIQHARNFPVAAGIVAGAVFEFGPDGLVFNAPVELGIAYAAGMIGSLTEDNLRIHKAVDANWVALLGSVDTANKIANATLDGFSMYGLKTISSGGGDTGGGGGTPDPSAIVPTWYGVQANILSRFCTMCHSGASPPMGLSWEADQYNTIVANARVSGEAPPMAIVQPGEPDTSYMYWKISGQGPNGEPIVGVRMPATGVALDQALIDVVAQWIRDGAPLGDPADADAGGGSGGSSSPVGSWMYVWSESLQVCTMCHSLTPSSTRCDAEFECPPKGVVLTADNYNGVVDDDIVEPGDLNGSKLWERVTENDPDKRMPFGLAPLTQPQLDIVRDWILDGAPFCPSGEVCQ